MTETTLLLDVDVGSPYTWLAVATLDERLRTTGIHPVFRPVLLGGIFKATGNHAPAINPTKARYMARELAELAEVYGVPYRFPSRFPLNTLLAQRTLCAWPDEVTLGDAVRALFHAYWAEDLDVSNHDVVLGVLATLRSDAEAIVDAAGSPEVKARLRANTEAAIAAGVFGLPAFHVGDRFWWGHDRIDLAIRAVERARREP